MKHEAHDKQRANRSDPVLGNAEYGTDKEDGEITACQPFRQPRRDQFQYANPDQRSEFHLMNNYQQDTIQHTIQQNDLIEQKDQIQQNGQAMREQIYTSACVKGLEFVYYEPTIVMRSERQWEAISNGVYNGGLKQAGAAINYRVSLDYASNDPEQDFACMLQQRGLDPEQTVGFMTAAKLSHAAISELLHHDFAMAVLATAGTSNATRAGSLREMYRGYHAGTINLFLWLDTRMSHAAMVNAIMTATEAKSAALADLAVVERANGLIATGTSTDAIFLAVSQNTAYAAEHQYAGTATELGCKLAQLVYAAVHMAVQTQQEQ